MVYMTYAISLAVLLSPSEQNSIETQVLITDGHKSLSTNVPLEETLQIISKCMEEKKSYSCAYRLQRW